MSKIYPSRNSPARTYAPCCEALEPRLLLDGLHATTMVTTGDATLINIPPPRVDGIRPGDQIIIVITMTAQGDTGEKSEPGIGVEPLTLTNSTGESVPFPFDVAPHSFQFQPAVENDTLTAQFAGFDGDETAKIDITVNAVPRCTQLYKDTLSDLASKSNKYGGRFGVASLLSVPVPVPGLTTALGIVAGLFTMIGSEISDVVTRDPADPNFTTVVQPTPPTLQPLAAGNGLTQGEADAFNVLNANLAQQIGLARAVVTSINRAGSAHDAGDAASEALQNNAIKQYQNQLAAAFGGEGPQLTALSGALQAGGFNLSLAAADVTNYQTDLMNNGLPPAAAQFLTSLGATQDQINNITSELIVQVADEVAGTLPADVAGQDILSSLQAAATIPNATLGTAHQRYVNQVYVDLFGRDADLTGLTAWSGFLDHGHADQEFATAITGSREYDGIIVDKLYVSYLGRHSDTAGLNGWVDLLQSGFNAENIRSFILSSDEYFNRTGGTDDSYVSALYTAFLHRSPDQAGLDAWKHVLNDPSGGRSAVAGGVSNSDENRTDLVTSYYRTYLGRDPDTQGLDGWKQLLANGISQPQIISFFVTTPEYLQRHGVG